MTSTRTANRTHREDTSTWAGRYAMRVSITDLLVLVWVVFGTQIVWLGFDGTALGFSGSRGDLAVGYTLVSVVIVAAWMLALRLFDTRSFRVLGVGSQEYRAVAGATVRLFGAVAIVAFLVKLDLARGYILMAFPLGLLVLLFSRWMWRQWLGVQRREGGYASRVVLVGSAESAATIARELARNPEGGYRVVAACVPDAERTLPGTDVAVAGGLEDTLDAMRALDADTVVVTSSGELSPEQIRRLSWELVPGHEHLVMAPGLVDIGGPRIHTRPVAGLPLIHVEVPRYAGHASAVKRVFDLVGATLLLVVASPLLLAIAIAIRTTSPGPALFVQTRVGLGGAPFRMLKFRTMVADAEARLPEARRTPAAGRERVGNEVLFKRADDPRVTRIGRTLRRYSLDELPQLCNVLTGRMSLVGPRPPLLAETDLYAAHVHRRFLVKPGITGLWQVSGRSTLSWDDSVRLDLYYVENWSLTGDLVILWRTLRAVVGRVGAY